MYGRNIYNMQALVSCSGST